MVYTWYFKVYTLCRVATFIFCCVWFIESAEYSVVFFMYPLAVLCCRVYGLDLPIIHPRSIRACAEPRRADPGEALVVLPIYWMWSFYWVLIMYQLTNGKSPFFSSFFRDMTDDWYNDPNNYVLYHESDHNFSQKKKHKKPRFSHLCACAQYVGLDSMYCGGGNLLLLAV